MNAPNIHSFSRVIPMVYAYNTPGVAYHDGWTKIGYTEKQTVEDRIRQQTHTADVRPVVAWQDNAMFKDGSGEYFTDRDFHAYLETQARVERQPKTEWFRVDGDGSLLLFNRFARRQGASEADERSAYALREEQEEAVRRTMEYFEQGGAEFLWNAKPRFGKTLTCCDLVRRMKMKSVLIVTNRPSIADSWANDFRRFIAWQEKLCFVADTDALRGVPGVLTHDEYVKMTIEREDGFDYGAVNFLSLQDMKGSVYLGGKFDKLDWVYEQNFDLLVVDESQEGVDTRKTDRAFNNIKRAHTLYLSGTPFRQLASGRFAENQIYNWSYADEQEKKEAWDGEEYNPYEALPRMEMYTYQLSPMIREKLEKGPDLQDEDGAVDYAFDLNEFFTTKENGKFEHEEEIKKFLHALTTQEKYPFSTPELRDELKHTLWYLNRVASAKALEKLLREDPVFSEYEIVLAAGDGKTDEDELLEDQRQKKALERVREAIRTHDKTITLTVGQLTVGVTVPEWSGVLMLCNLKSPSSYMQAAFRAQNPCVLTVNGQRMRKQTAYVFDFDPARTLIIFDEFANNLRPETAGDRGTGDDRAENIRRLLNFFPVIGEDSEGRMAELDERQVLSIPRRLKSQEVVRRGFMSNFLFQHISNIFGAPAAVREIVEKIAPAQEQKGKKGDPNALAAMDDVQVDDQGEVVVDDRLVIGTAQGLFGEKVFEELPPEVDEAFKNTVGSGDHGPVDSFDDFQRAVWEDMNRKRLAAIAEYPHPGKRTKKQIEEQMKRDIEALNEVREDFAQKTRVAEARQKRLLETAETAAERAAVNVQYDLDIEKAIGEFAADARSKAQQVIADNTRKTVEILEKNKKETVRRSVEEEVRSHLRGFSRTIPSFIMAYDDGGLTLANFDAYTEDDVFLEVTGITEENFRFLRDGGEYVNEKGETERFPGHLFDETVFNDSIAEFRQLRERLKNYFDEGSAEDIFDYIPPQKTNQIFTPRRIVSMMADELEKQNPGCFDDPTGTFADLYMKSGLYITEIVKRLYRSEKMKQAIPDDGERIRYILRKQVYGMAPTRIIYLIATNYILGFDETMKSETKNFVEADAAEAAKNGELQALVDRYFGI